MFDSALLQVASKKQCPDHSARPTAVNMFFGIIIGMIFTKRRVGARTSVNVSPSVKCNAVIIVNDQKMSQSLHA